MKLQPDDTTPEAERALIEMLRRAPTWKRAEQLGGLIHSRNVLILADLRRRYPEAGEEELRKRLASRLLPREDVIRVFGWDPEKEGY
ncbi:MAG TPA: hypothetical protein VGP08_22815 [Pyrinomonadaceae bacterium]|nr:hypothetical protein [Pyrinomonadaceae bacterium]